MTYTVGHCVIYPLAEILKIVSSSNPSVGGGSGASLLLPNVSERRFVDR